MKLLGGGDQQPVGDDRARGLGEELVDVGLRDGVLRGIRIGLDRPQPTAVVLGDPDCDFSQGRVSHYSR
jgi:hypothetical protein